MFTGIIQDVGVVESISRKGKFITLGVKSKVIAVQSKISDSIAVNGICLTLVNIKSDVMFFEAVASTLALTNIKRLKKGGFANLEPALKAGDRLGGHFVLGHVDAELKLIKILSTYDSSELTFDLPSRFRKFIIENGSIALEGVSLTVKKIISTSLTVNIIPFTYKNTNLKYKKRGDYLNAEFDYLLKNRAK